MIRASALSLTILLLAACGPTEPVKCTMANCSGCCTEAGECLAPARQTAMECGPAGSTCGACLPGQMCSASRCVKDPNAVVVLDDGGVEMPDAGRADSGVQCGSLGTPCCASGAACYLTLTCQSGVCRQPVADAGACGALGQSCCTNSTCTAVGTTCSAGTCVAQMTTDAGTDGGTTLRSAGEACTADTQCVDGTCLQNGFNGGYCTKSCNASSDCFAGSQCGVNPSPIGPTRICLKQCSSPGVAPGGCRSGYVCEANAGTSGVPVCYPGCTSVTQCGAAPDCDSRGFCCGGAGSVCCEGNTCLNGTTCMSGTCRTAGSGGGGGSTGGGGGSTGGGSGSTGGGTGATGGGGGSTGGGTGSMSLSGSPCTDFSECVGNRCITGGQWTGGYCSETCAGSAGCRSGSSCSYALFSGSSTRYCLETCVWTGGQSSCRAGYVCERNLIPDQATTAACFPACTAASQCGTSNFGCESGFCCGRSSYRCCTSGTACRDGTTCQGDGYCG